MRSIVIILFVFLHLLAISQEHDNQFNHPQKLTMVMGYSLIDNSFSSSTDDILIVPTFGINYDYYFTPKWGAGLHSDIILQQFTIEKHGSSDVLVRDNPIAICGMLIFKPTHHWVVNGGYGIEYEKDTSFQLIRLGVEYEVPIRNNWELSFSSEYDIKFNAYSSIVFGVGFTKIFGK